MSVPLTLISTYRTQPMRTSLGSWGNQMRRFLCSSWVLSPEVTVYKGHNLSTRRTLGLHTPELGAVDSVSLYFSVFSLRATCKEGCDGLHCTSEDAVGSTAEVTHSGWSEEG